nr:MAG TPA: hypothetical protein [Caudoviricetes sp.]
MQLYRTYIFRSVYKIVCSDINKILETGGCKSEEIQLFISLHSVL